MRNFVTVHNTLEVSKRNDKETVRIKHFEHRKINTLRREKMSSGSRKVWRWIKTSGESVEREGWTYSDVVCDRWRTGAGPLNIATKRDTAPISQRISASDGFVSIAENSDFDVWTQPGQDLQGGGGTWKREQHSAFFRSPAWPPPPLTFKVCFFHTCFWQGGLGIWMPDQG